MCSEITYPAILREGPSVLQHGFGDWLGRVLYDAIQVLGESCFNVTPNLYPSILNTSDAVGWHLKNLLFSIFVPYTRGFVPFLRPKPYDLDDQLVFEALRGFEVRVLA
jgi:hypothetical protein